MKKTFTTEMLIRAVLGAVFPPLAVFDCGVLAVISVLLSMVIGGFLGILWGVAGVGLLLGRGLSVLVGEVVALSIAAVKIKHRKKETEGTWRFAFGRRNAIKLAMRSAVAFFFPPFAASGMGCGGLIAVTLMTILGLPYLGCFPGAIYAILCYLRQHNYYRVPIVA